CTGTRFRPTVRSCPPTPTISPWRHSATASATGIWSRETERKPWTGSGARSSPADGPRSALLRQKSKSNGCKKGLIDDREWSARCASVVDRPCGHCRVSDTEGWGVGCRRQGGGRQASAGTDGG